VPFLRGDDVRAAVRLPANVLMQQIAAFLRKTSKIEPLSPAQILD
jgi:hypothetical protein